jgi:hypothetical protein
MDDNRTQAAIWISAFLTLLALAFTISSCDQKKTAINAQATIACARMGGEWGPVRGTSASYTCIKKGQ